MNNKLFNDLTTGYFFDRLFAYMDVVGLQRITIEYSGGGDSGGMDNISFHPAVKDSVADGIRDTFEDELCSPIYTRHGGFADGGGYYVSGEVTYDAIRKTVFISGTDHITEYSDYDEETGESEEETREECWEECIYNKNLSNNTLTQDSADYLFVNLYAENFLENKLPEEFHNRLLIEAANGNAGAVSYIENLK